MSVPDEMKFTNLQTVVVSASFDRLIDEVRALESTELRQAYLSGTTYALAAYFQEAAPSPAVVEAQRRAVGSTMAGVQPKNPEQLALFLEMMRAAYLYVEQNMIAEAPVH